MSWKPCRGGGVVFKDAHDRELKYRAMLVGYLRNPASFMQYSKTYYHWLVAERDFEKVSNPLTARNINELYGCGIPMSTLRSFEQNKSKCYKPLQRLMP